MSVDVTVDEIFGELGRCYLEAKKLTTLNTQLQERCTALQARIADLEGQLAPPEPEADHKHEYAVMKGDGLWRCRICDAPQPQPARALPVGAY